MAALYRSLAAFSRPGNHVSGSLGLDVGYLWQGEGRRRWQALSVGPASAIDGTGVAVPAIVYETTAAGLSRNTLLLSSQVEDLQVQYAIDVNSDGLIGGAQYYDAQVTFAERLVIENVISAAAAGFSAWPATRPDV